MSVPGIHPGPATSRPSRIAVHIAAAVAVLAAATATAPLLHDAAVVDRDPPWSAGLDGLLMLGAVGLAFWAARRPVHRAAGSKSGRARRDEWLLRVGVLAAAVSAWAVLPGGMHGLALLPIYVLSLAQAAALARVAGSPRGAAQCVVMSVGLVLISAATAPGASVFLLLPAGLATCGAATALVHADLVRPAVARSVYSLNTARVERSDVAARIVAGSSFGMVGLLALLVLYPLVAQAPWHLFGPSADGDRRQPRIRSGRRGPRRSPRSGERGTSLRNEPSLSFDISSEDLPVPTDEVLLEVKPSVAGRPTGDMGSLHLRGMVRAAFATERAREAELSELPVTTDDADGWSDGWTVVSANASGADPLELHITQYPLRIEPLGWNLVFHPVPLYAVSLPSLRHDPDRMCVTTEPYDEWFEYRLHARRPTAPWPGIRAAQARHPHGRFTDLPPPSVDLDRIGDLALEVTSSSATDYARVRAIENYFWLGFEYTIEGTESAGLAGIVEFLERGGGYCTYYATAAVVMLRSLGIPARIASGFLATDWSEERSAYVVRSKDRHDWVEVYFKDLGWVTIDPTPPQRREAALAKAMEEGKPGMAEWGQRLAARLREEASLDVLADELTAAPGALLRSVRRHPAVTLGLMILIVLAIALRVHARRARKPTRARTASEAAADAFYGRLLRVLRSKGYRKPRAATPREFAEAVVEQGGPELEPARELTEVYYASRYGGQPIADRHRDRLRQFPHEVTS